jgi:ribosomal protein L30E
MHAKKMTSDKLILGFNSTIWYIREDKVVRLRQVDLSAGCYAKKMTSDKLILGFNSTIWYISRRNHGHQYIHIPLKGVTFISDPFMQYSKRNSV